LRIEFRYFTMLFAGACAVAVLTAPMAGAQTDPTLPQCTDTGGAVAIGGTTTECATYVYPWDDEFYGSALIIGGGGGYHGGGGGHSGR